jgi:tRNA A37 methylthiotransferase MiaB
MKYKILILDIYPKAKYRISKDLNGGYGTGNDYGDSWFSKLLKLYVRNAINFPTLFSVQVCGELNALGHDVDFKNNSSKINFDNYDLILVPSSIVCHESEIEVIKTLSKLKKVLVIGPFGSANPENYIKSGAAVLKGEPENFFHNIDLIEFINNFKVEIIQNNKLVSLDDLSLPGWETVFKDSTPVMKFLGKGPAINLYASKGCPYSCFYYCVYPMQQGRKLRLKSPKKVVDEMIYFFHKLNVKNYIFRDPVFSIDRKHTILLCEEIIKSKIKFNIAIETHLKNIDNELANIFLRCGIILVYVGIESADEEVKQSANRWSDEDDVQIEKINYLEKIGIKVKTMYIIGFPEENKEKFLKTVDYAIKVNSSYAQFSVFTPYPGTPVYKEYEKKITATKFEDFNQWKLVFKHKNFDESTVRYLLDLAYKRYYLRLSWIKNFLKNKLFT